jgi:hypothetical protein
MKSSPKTLFLAAAATLGMAAPALAQPQMVHPALASGVVAAPAYVKPQGDYVVTNGTPLYKQPVWMPGTETGVELKRGDHPTVLGETDGGLWLLVGRGGQGVGYVSRSLTCMTKICGNVRS